MIKTRVRLLAISCAIACSSVGAAQNQQGPVTTRDESRNVYTFKYHDFAAAIGAARDPESRTAALARRWDAVKLAVTHVHVVESMAFHSSIAYWQDGYLATRKWTGRADGDLTEPLVLNGRNSILIKGDCRARVVSSNDAVVHIAGDVDAEVSVRGQCEVVVAGDVKAGGSIVGDGIVRIFVGGDVDGSIRNLGSSTVWVNGDLRGTITTGSPSTRLRIMGDALGKVMPESKGALLYLEVQGYAPFQLLTDAARQSYTEFDASIGASDKKAGMYGGDVGVWVIHRQAENTDANR